METQSEILKLADSLKNLRAKKDEFNDILKNVNSQIEETETALIQEMMQAEMSKFDRNGTLFSIRLTKHSSIIPEEKGNLYANLKENGYEDLFSINSQTFNSFCKELMEENDGELPEWIADKVKLYEKPSIQLRKS